METSKIEKSPEIGTIYGELQIPLDAVMEMQSHIPVNDVATADNSGPTESQYPTSSMVTLIRFGKTGSALVAQAAYVPGDHGAISFLVERENKFNGNRYPREYIVSSKGQVRLVVEDSEEAVELGQDEVTDLVDIIRQSRVSSFR